MGSAAKGKRIVITGATKGLGRALVAGFSKLGHEVIGCGRSVEAIEDLRLEPGPAGNFEVVDVVDAGQVEAWAQGILARAGAPDLLINNAALINPNAPLWEVPAEDFDRVIDVNLKGVANVIRSFLPAMIGQGTGVVVNLSSGWGRSTSPEVAPYCATKWGIEGLTRALAQELPKGLAAIPLNPGIIDTDMLRSTFGGRASGFPDAQEWSESAVPFLLQLGPKDNGKPLTVPGH